MELAEFKPLAYLESETSQPLPGEASGDSGLPAHRGGAGRALADTALGEGESRALIATVATELYADREDHDDRA
jgi:hypothetical protein